MVSSHDATTRTTADKMVLVRRHILRVDGRVVTWGGTKGCVMMLVLHSPPYLVGKA